MPYLANIPAWAIKLKVGLKKSLNNKFLLIVHDNKQNDKDREKILIKQLQKNISINARKIKILKSEELKVDYRKDRAKLMKVIIKIWV